MCGKEYPVLHHCVLVSNTNTTLHVWFVQIKVKGISCTISTNFCTFSRCMRISRWYPRVFTSRDNNNKRKLNRWLNNSFRFWFICRVLYAGKERLMYGCDFVYDTPSGKEANVNNSTNSKTFITYRRARQKMAHSSLAVTEICIIIASKVLKNPELILVLAHGRRNYNHQNFWWLA